MSNQKLKSDNEDKGEAQKIQETGRLGGAVG